MRNKWGDFTIKTASKDRKCGGIVVGHPTLNRESLGLIPTGITLLCPRARRIYSLKFICHLSRCIRKPTICICENKGTDQLRSNREAFVFASRIVQSLFFLNPNFNLLAFFCDCTGWFVSDMVGNSNCWFSCAKAHFIVQQYP